MFRSYGSTPGHPLILRDVLPVHDVPALPDTRKRKVPEIAVNDILKACANKRHFLMVLQVGLQPEIQNKINKLSIIYILCTISNLIIISNLSKLSIQNQKRILHANFQVQQTVDFGIRCWWEPRDDLSQWFANTLEKHEKIPPAVYRGRWTQRKSVVQRDNQRQSHVTGRGTVITCALPFQQKY